MDPYLEKHWGDVHTRLITYASDHLQKVLPRDLRARVEERLVVTGIGRPRRIFPDVRIFETRRKPRRPANGAAGLAVAEPMLIELPGEPETQRFIEIRDVSTGSRLVTVLEVLSLSNKQPGDAQEQYLRKQQELLQAGVSLVEIDLLREGDWIVAVPYERLTRKARTLYRVAVRRGWRYMEAEYYPISLQSKLPTIQVPLRPTDRDAPLDLQALLEQCYENGGYDDIDYNREPEPPLPPAAARWATKLLRRLRRRPAGKRKP
jgi:hypothetical protein